MIEVSYLRELEKLKLLPKEVQEITQGILKILDTEYGADRNKYEDDGGYVVVIEKGEDLKQLKDKTYIVISHFNLQQLSHKNLQQYHQKKHPFFQDRWDVSFL